jgi:hypothetical protein
MANQEKGDRKDRTGGDVTKAEAVPAPVVEKTNWDIVNATGPNSVGDRD